MITGRIKNPPPSPLFSLGFRVLAPLPSISRKNTKLRRVNLFFSRALAPQTFFIQRCELRNERGTHITRAIVLISYRCSDAFAASCLPAFTCACFPLFPYRSRSTLLCSCLTLPVYPWVAWSRVSSHASQPFFFARPGPTDLFF